MKALGQNGQHDGLMRRVLVVIGMLLVSLSLWDCGNRKPLNDCSISNPCANGYQCNFGRCKCDAPRTLCQTTCVDSTSDVQHCGGCGIACGAGQSCVQGQCSGVQNCPVGTVKCQGQCTNTTNDRQHCGACDKPCGLDQRCQAGICVNGGPEPPTPDAGPIDRGAPDQPLPPMDQPAPQDVPTDNASEPSSPDIPPQDRAMPPEPRKMDRTPPSPALWAKVPDTVALQYGRAAATDSAGNVYITGWMTGQATFGATKLTSKGGRDIFVAKLDSKGNWLWAANVGSPASDEGASIAVDFNGDVYVTGYFRSRLTHGSITLTARGADAVVLKWSKDGKPLGARNAGSVGEDEGYGITTDSKGDVFVTGYFRGTAAFGALNVKSDGGTDVFIAKLSGKTGDWLWAKRGGSPLADAGTGIATDISGNVLVTGYYSGKPDFGPVKLNSKGNDDTFVTKLDTSGNWIWTKTAGDNGIDRANALATDSSGNAFIVGTFQRDMEFDAIKIKANDDRDAFIAKIDASGKWVWAKQASSKDNLTGFGVAVDTLGNAVMTGYFERDGNFAGNQITAKGVRDAFVAKITGSGTWLWAKRGGGPANDEGFGVAVDSGGNAYVTGYFQGSADFDGIALKPKAGIAAFIWKVGP